MRAVWNWFKHHAHGVSLTGGFLLMFSAYEGGRVLHIRPNSYHIWRQSDCLSLTANYAEGRSFLEPEIHFRIGDDGRSGKSAGEFPLIYWGIGQLWKVFGQSEFIYRLFGILLHFLATWCLSLAMVRVLHSVFWSVCTSLLLYTSPVIVYYSIGFLTDVPALDLAIIGWYCVIRHGQELQRRWWMLAVLCFALAALLKVTAGMSLIALMAVLLLAHLRPAWFGGWSRYLPSSAFGSLTGLAGMGAVAAWYVYAERYNTLHGGRYTFNNVWPLWEMTSDEIGRACEFASRILVHQLFDTSVWLVMAAALVYLLVSLKHAPRLLLLLNALLIAGVAGYTILWFHAVDGHDYYFINPLIMPIVLWVSFLVVMNMRHPGFLRSKAARLAFVLLLSYNTAYAANNMCMRYSVFGPLDESGLIPVHHPHEVPFWSLEDYYGLGSTLDMATTLNELGIPKDALVVYLDDVSFNASLYLMGRKGWTSFGRDWSNAGELEWLKERGARYLIFSEGKWYQNDLLAPYLIELKGRHGRASIFDLHAVRRNERIDSVVVWAHGVQQDGSLEARVDTLACARGPEIWCLGEGQYPLSIKWPMPGDTALRRSLWRVEGVLDLEPNIGEGKVVLGLGQDDGTGQVTLLEHELVNGPFRVELPQYHAPKDLSSTLFLWNPSGRALRLSNLRISMVHAWGEFVETGVTPAR